MDKLTFKNYPTSIVTFLICLIVAINFAYKSLWSMISGDKALQWNELGKEMLLIVLSYSTVKGIFSLINLYVKRRWIFNLLGLGYVDGHYTGKMVSSYHIDDNPERPHIERYCNINIIQNLNALKIEGDVYSDKKLNDRTSHFTSSWEEIKKKDNGHFELRYFFSNKGSQLHPDNKKYGLTNHDGVAVLTFNPNTNKMEGYYYTHERRSGGEIFMELKR